MPYFSGILVGMFEEKHTHMDILLTLVLTAAGTGCFGLFYLSIDFFENI